MVIFGPEYYNYKMIKKHWNILNQNEQHLFIAAHKVLKGGLIETMAEFEEGDTILGGLLRIEAAIGPVRQLERIKKKAPLSELEIKDMILKDPLIIIKRPKTIEEIKFKITHKLYTTGAKEALKNLAASIFYGRVSATVSSKCFYIPNSGIQKQTYLECLTELVFKESIDFDIMKQIKFIYPKHGDYDLFIDNDDIRLNFKNRNPLEIQTIQHLVTHKIYTKLTQSVPDLLDYKWQGKVVPDNLFHKVERDFFIMKQHFPLIKDTIQETKDQFTGTPEEKTKSVLLLILKLYSLRERVFKGVIFGSGSQDITRTYEVLLEKNSSQSINARITNPLSFQRTEMTFDRIYSAYNHSVLSAFSESKILNNPWQEIQDSELAMFFQDPIINRGIKKRILLIALSEGFIKNVEEWSGRVGVILHLWHIKQKRTISGTYEGDFDISLFSGHQSLSCQYKSKTHIYKLSKFMINDPELLYEFILELTRILNCSVDDIIKHTDPGDWVIVDNKALKSISSGFRLLEIKNYSNLEFGSCKLDINEDWTKLFDEDGYNLFNMETGLLATNYTFDIKYDFKVFGLSFIKMCSSGCFNQSFSIMYSTRVLTLDLLDDVDVDRPSITKVTVKRLGLPDNWNERKVEEVCDDITIEDNTDLYGEILQMDMTLETIQEMTKNQSGDDDDLDEMIDFLKTTDSIFSMKTLQRVQHTRKLFLQLKYLKYDLIAKHILQDMRINKSVIKAVNRIFTNGSRFMIMYSLISFYDRLYQIETMKSPENINFDIDSRFLLKFNLKADIIDDLNDI
jgi:hypothetical protein